MSWIQTFTGKRFYPLEPDPTAIDIFDIAHSLSNTCRFAGHCTSFYSVAQHSVFVSNLVTRENSLWGLLHDASEAYLQDFVRPLKLHASFAAAYAQAEERLMQAICERFGLPKTIPAEVAKADNYMLRREKRDLMVATSYDHEWEFGDLGTERMPVDDIKPLSPSVAREAFLKRFYRLYDRER